jgi:8-oxo-dGTP diphosphatase
MASRDGNGWVRCELGHRHWGRFGAAGLLAFVTAGPVLVQRRTWWSHHGGTWGLPGGARDSHESALAAALREAAEECGVPPEAVRPRGVFTDDHGGWSYTTVLADAENPFAVYSDDDETDEVAWVPEPAVARLDLHPGLAAHWDELRRELSPVTIIVDGANVVGSRPDGWWRDRPGAAIRLRDELAPLVTRGIIELPADVSPARPAGGSPDDDSPDDDRPNGDGPDDHGLDGHRPDGDGPRGADGAQGGRRDRRDQAKGGKRDRAADGRTGMRWLPDIVLVVEGAARPAAADSDGSPVRVVAAQGSGDDTIAALAAQIAGRRLVVTADRELRQRCLAAGAAVAGPGWLLALT